jgi:hypothetical protein
MHSSLSQHPAVRRARAEVLRGLSLSAYFAAWFCALSFLKVTVLHDRSFSLSLFGLACVKAGLCTKFLLIGEALFPLNVKGSRGIIAPLVRQSFLYLAIVLVLTVVEIGVEGWIHGRGFEISLLSIGDGDPLRIAAISLVYWLILFPYLALRGIADALGVQEVRSIFFGSS